MRQKTEREKDNEKHSTSADPLFVDVKNGDFRLRSGSPALKLGIRSIAVKEIGLTKDFPERFRSRDEEPLGLRSYLGYG